MADGIQALNAPDDHEAPTLGALSAGTIIGGRYRVDERLAEGGMATVFLAADLRHDRRVAVKVLHESLAHTIGIQRFLREIEVVARLQHPHLLTLIDSGTIGDFPYYVMPYVEAQSLRETIAERASRGRVIAEAGGDCPTEGDELDILRRLGDELARHRSCVVPLPALVVGACEESAITRIASATRPLRLIRLPCDRLLRERHPLGGSTMRAQFPSRLEHHIARVREPIGRKRARLVDAATHC